MEGDGAEAEAGLLEEVAAGEGLLVLEVRGEIHFRLRRVVGGGEPKAGAFGYLR